jgi:hypothetical protein
VRLVSCIILPSECGVPNLYMDPIKPTTPIARLSEPCIPALAAKPRSGARPGARDQARRVSADRTARRCGWSPAAAMCRVVVSRVLGASNGPAEDHRRCGGFPPEPTRSRVRAGSVGQGRPFGRPALRGRLDGRVIRRATLGCLRLRLELASLAREMKSALHLCARALCELLKARRTRPCPPATRPAEADCERLAPRRFVWYFFIVFCLGHPLCFPPPLCRRRAPKAGIGRVRYPMFDSPEHLRGLS